MQDSTSSKSNKSSQTQGGKYSKRLSNAESSGFHESFRLDQDFFRNLVESLDDYAVFTTDLDGTISSWNVGAEGLFGYDEQEMIGKSADILFDSTDIKKVLLLSR